MEQELKQRMIGVTIIVALAVIFVPMLFDKREDKGKSVNGVPPIPENVLETHLELPKSAEDAAPKDEKSEEQSGFKIIPLTESPTEKPEAKPVQREVEREPTAAEALVAPDGEEEGADVVAEKPVKVIDKPRHESVPKSSVSTSVETPVKSAVVEKIADVPKKPKPSIEAPIKKSESPVVAPQSKSEQVASSVRKTKPVEPSAVVTKSEVPPVPVAKPVIPKASAAVPQVSKPISQEVQKPSVIKSVPEVPPAMDVWVIQTGSFTSETKARALAEKLRQSRFPAFVESAASEHGTTFRVQVGPELDRARAEQIQKQIEAGSGIKGIIVPHP